jgi:dTDP-4-dehydrorhamnose reductase
MDKPKVLVVGAGGFLGAYLAQAAADKYQVVKGERSPVDPDGQAIDIGDASSVYQAFQTVQPEAVILAAAISDIDRCEAQPELAFTVNVRGAELVANLCARTNARLMFTSTAAVFDGRKHGYREDGEMSPLSVYGKTKARAEMIVRALLPEALVIRFSLVLGFAAKQGTNSALDNLNKNWKAGTPVALSTDEFRNPVHAAPVSEIMISLLANHKVSGIYHVGASDSMSRYEMAKRLAARAGFPDDLVRPQTQPVLGRAPRGNDHFLLTDKLQRLCGAQSPTCEQVIERCFDGIA